MVLIIVILLTMAVGFASDTDVCLRNTEHQLLGQLSESKIMYIMEEFLMGTTHFSLSLLRTLNQTTNLFISPFSVWSSLVLLYLGSRGQTEKELQGVLGLQNVDKNILPIALSFFEQRFSSGTTSPFRTSFNAVNKLFLQTCTNVQPCLSNFVTEKLAFVDFLSDPELARLSINLWVQQKTKGRIREILPYHSVHYYTEFVATSAVYFKGAWLQPFHPHLTSPRPFFTTSRKFFMTDAMVTKNTYFFATSDELQCSAVELPYVGGKISMMILLPNNVAHGVKILVNSLTYSRLESLQDDMFPRVVMVQLPKFQMDSRWQLSSMLYKLGLRHLFGFGLADLGGFSKDRRLNVNEIFHKTYVLVNEQGTEAAASTSSAESRSARPTRVVNFVVDRPFVFYIRENHHGVILFMGVVSTPG